MTADLIPTQAAALVVGDDLGDAWAAALDAWLQASLRRTGSANTRRAYEHALNGWLSFLASMGRRPDQAGGVEIETYQQVLTDRGSSPATIAQRLAVISSFYRFCRDKYTLQGPTGREVTLIDYNPVERATRPKIEAFSHSQKIPVELLPELLQKPDRATLQGIRDYSILLAYLMTGRRLAELARLTWGDLYFIGQTVFYTYTGKGKGEERKTRQLPPPAWAALTEYIKAGHRQMAEDSPLWTAHSDAGRYLPNVTQAGSEQALSVAMIRRLVNRYTRLTFGRKVSPHALRHAAAALRKQAGDDVYSIQKFLDHSSLATTAGYLQKIDPAKDTSWQAAANLLGI